MASFFWRRADESSEFIDQMDTPPSLSSQTRKQHHVMEQEEVEDEEEAMELGASSFAKLSASAAARLTSSPPVKLLRWMMCENELPISFLEGANLAIKLNRTQTNETYDLIQSDRTIHKVELESEFQRNYAEESLSGPTTILHCPRVTLMLPDTTRPNLTLTLWIPKSSNWRCLIPSGKVDDMRYLNQAKLKESTRIFKQAHIGSEVTTEDEEDDPLSEHSKGGAIASTLIRRSSPVPSKEAIEISDDEVEVETKDQRSMHSTSSVSGAHGSDGYAWRSQLRGNKASDSGTKPRTGPRHRKTAQKAKSSTGASKSPTFAKSSAGASKSPTLDRYAHIDLTGEDRASVKRSRAGDDDRNIERQKQTRSLEEEVNTKGVFERPSTRRRIPTADEIEDRDTVDNSAGGDSAVLDYVPMFIRTVHNFFLGKTPDSGRKEKKEEYNLNKVSQVERGSHSTRPLKHSIADSASRQGSGLIPISRDSIAFEPLVSSREIGRSPSRDHPFAVVPSTFQDHSSLVVLDDEEGDPLFASNRLHVASSSSSKDIENRPTKEMERVLFTYPEGSQDSVSIRQIDLMKLSEDTFLNDSLIDFYLKHTVNMDVDVSVQQRVHVFTSYLYTKMADGLKDRFLINLNKLEMFGPDWFTAYAQLRRWTVGVDIFSKTCIIFPINSGLHWSFAACCFENRSDRENPPHGKILTFDSARGVSSHDPVKIAELIRIYLNHEFESRIRRNIEPKPRNIITKTDGTEDDDDDDFVPQVVDNVEQKKQEEIDPTAFVLETIHFDESTLPLWRVAVPQQRDGVNCGVHLLNNAKTLIQIVTEIFPQGIDQMDDFIEPVESAFSSLEFHTEDANKMRNDLKQEIKDIAAQAELKRSLVKSNVLKSG